MKGKISALLFPMTLEGCFKLLAAKLGNRHFSLFIINLVDKSYFFLKPLNDTKVVQFSNKHFYFIRYSLPALLSIEIIWWISFGFGVRRMITC